MSWPWNELGLPGPAGLPEIRRAYAQRLKTTHPEEDPEGFQRLHAAYQEASRYARRQNQQRAPQPEPERRYPSEQSRSAVREDDLQKTSEEEKTEEAGWDYDELLKNQQGPKKAPEKTEEPKETEWDYDELLKNQQEPKKAPEKSEEPKETEWDYDELLKNQQGPKKAPQKTEETEETEWDYDELLKGQQGPKRAEESREPDDELPKEEKAPEEESQGSAWDYERLFAEGEEEARQARRRRMEALRQKNRARFEAQEREQRKRAADEEEAWTAVMAATHALELLYSNGAPLSQWARFLNDPVFWNVRANLDFLFALEDFIEQHPDLSQDIRKAIFSAYGFEKGPGQQVYRRLYQLLGVGRREKRKMAKANSRWRAAWRSYPVWRKMVIAVCFTILAAFLLIGTAVNLRLAYEDFSKRKSAEKWEVQSLEWLEEDFGEPFI